MRAAVAMFFTCLPVVLHAQALPVTVGAMERACETITADDGQITPENAVAVGACFGAMRGVVQVMQANCRSFGAGQRPAPALSVGEVPSPAAAISAFTEWAEANPDNAEAPAEYGIILSLAQAFPCRAALPPAVPRPQVEEGAEVEEPGQEEPGQEPKE